MGKSRNTEKSWQNAYVTEQRQPAGHVGGGRFTSGYINPASAAAQRNQAAVARHQALVSGAKPHSSSGGSASAGSTGSAGGGKTGSDAEDRAEAEEAHDLIAQAKAIEQQIDQLNADLKAASKNITSAQAGAAPGAATGAAQSATAAAAAAAKPGAAAGSSTQTTAQYVASLQSKVSSLREQIKDLKAKRRQLLKRARALLRDARKASRPSVVKSEQRDDLSERILTALADGTRVRLGAAELRDLLG